jgi:hypothetical protein
MFFSFAFFLLSPSSHHVEQPSELNLSDLHLYTKTEGEFQGRRALLIKGLSGDKTCKLSLKNTELRNVSDSNFDDMVENPGDKFCVIRLHELVVARYERVDPSYKGRVFRRAVRKRGKPTYLPNMKPGGVIGHNHFGVITKAIAHRTGMEQPDKCTPSARRRAGITKLANKSNGVAEAVRLRAARHTNSEIHARYQDMNEEQMAGRYKAFHYSDYDYGECQVCFSTFIPRVLIQTCSLKLTVLNRSPTTRKQLKKKPTSAKILSLPT